MSIVILDIETVGVGEVDPLSLKPPGTLKKPESIEAWYKNEAVSIAAEKTRARALDSMNSQIICLGYCIDDDPVVVISGESLDEKGILESFHTVIFGLRGKYNEPIEFAGWNVRAFDMNFIWQRACKYNLQALKKSINRDRTKGNIRDMMLDWGADYRDLRKAKDVAAYLGIENNDPYDGSMVHDLYLDGNWEGIASHCRSDVEMEREIYRRIY